MTTSALCPWPPKPSMAYLTKQQMKDAEALAYRVGLSKRQGHDGTFYTREEWDLDGRPILCTYRVEEPFVPISCVPLPIKRYP